MNIYNDSKPSPCYKCPKRTIGCHATCKEGLEADAQRAKEREKFHDLAAKLRRLNSIGHHH